MPFLSDELPDIEPDHTRMWCRCCEANVETVLKDCGIGVTEYWGSRSVHHDWQETCAICGDDCLEGARTEEEMGDA